MLYRLLTKSCFRPIARFMSHLSHRPFTVLALESSADDTCAAILTARREVLSNVVVKQYNVHALHLRLSKNTLDAECDVFVRHERFGGIFPPEAIASHQRNMPAAIQRALSESQLTVTELDGIAFTRGPGMGGCLSVAANAAKALAAALGKPLVGVHHMQAHALTPFLTLPLSDLPTFPFLTLLISGGHTLLLLARSPTSFNTLATTPDESIGNAYDKVSKLLALPWTSLGPGAALERFCLDHPPVSESNPLLPGHEKTIKFEPIFPLPRRGELIFSYSGMFSSVQRYVEALPPGELTPDHKARVAWAFQRAAVGQLEEKLRLGFRWCSRHNVDVRHVVVSGGVASNGFLRERLRRSLDAIHAPHSISLVFPPVALCTDNAAMIAWAAMDRFLRNDHDPYEIDLRPLWSIEDLYP